MRMTLTAAKPYGQAFTPTVLTVRCCRYSEDGKLYAIYDNMPDGTVKCVIGAKTKKEACNELTEVILPKTEWAVFTLGSTDDAYVALMYTKILYEWLPSAGLEKRTDIPTTDVYPADMDKDGFSWEIRIPIK
ncbi:MAG: GyrI-like domain-containing protein [Acutalibacteraceae bacterium]|nr:GyrI-like domain-containing protein [Acutalibacteraceae bacterium]